LTPDEFRGVRKLAAVRYRELGRELDAWEDRTRPVDERLAGFRARPTEHDRLVRDGYAALGGGTCRREAETVRKLFRIVLHFRREKRANYARTVRSSPTGRGAK
jgi:hypothetical protein